MFTCPKCARASMCYRVYGPYQRRKDIVLRAKLLLGPLMSWRF